MVPHGTSICKSSYCHLRNIDLIRNFITFEATTLHINAFDTYLGFTDEPTEEALACTKCCCSPPDVLTKIPTHNTKSQGASLPPCTPTH